MTFLFGKKREQCPTNLELAPKQKDYNKFLKLFKSLLVTGMLDVTAPNFSSQLEALHEMLNDHMSSINNALEAMFNIDIYDPSNKKDFGKKFIIEDILTYVLWNNKISRATAGRSIQMRAIRDLRLNPQLQTIQKSLRNL